MALGAVRAHVVAMVVGQWPVSIGGGYQPRWRRDGRELFYVSPGGQLMSVAITPGLASPPGRPTPLFQTAIFGGGPLGEQLVLGCHAGRGALSDQPVIAGNEPSILNVVLHWQSGLGR